MTIYMYVIENNEFKPQINALYAKIVINTAVHSSCINTAII